MNTNAVNVAVVDGKTITESVELRATQQGQPVRIKAVQNGKYILAEGGDKPVAPENITIKRVGNDLHVATEGTSPDQPQLIIEGFFESQGQLVGVAEDGAYYEYISSDGDQDRAAAFLHDGASSPQVLGADELVGFGNGLVAGNGIGWFWPALLGLGALGLLGAGYALTRDDDKNHDGGGAVVVPPTPGLGGATDNVGDIQGPIDKGGSTDDTTPTFGGTGTPGNTIIISDNGKPIGEVIVGDDGKWTYTPPTPLPGGEHSIVVEEKDKDGNISKPSDEFDFIIDITAPGKSVINSISDDVGDQQGVISPNGFTDDNTPTLSGTGEAGARLDVFANGVKIGETTVNPDGTWSFTPSPALVDGQYSFTTVAIDAAGNVGLPSDPYIVTIDTIAPVKPGIGTGGIEEAIDNVGPITGDIGDGGVTDDGTPTFGGGGLTPGDKVSIIDDGVVIGEVIVGDDGRWEFTPDPALAEGPHPITVIVTDPAGNTSEPSDPYIVIVDTTAPGKPGVGTGGIEEAIDNVGPIIGDIGNGGVTDDGTPTFGGGGLTPGDKVTIIDDGVAIGEVIVGDDGRWEFTPDPALAEGPHPITVIVTDPAGNASEPSDPYIVIVDTTAPGKPGVGTGGIEEAIDNVGPITGDIGNGGSTDDGTPTVGGGGLTPGDKVTIIDDGVVIGEVIVGDDGRWEFTPDPALAEGPHPITVIVTDPAGNASEPSDPYIIIVDTTAPLAPTIDSVFDDQGTSTGNLTPGDITDDAQPEISGSGEPGSTIIIYDNGVEIGRAPVGTDGRWSHTPVPPLLNGPHDLTAAAQDAVGNISDPSTGFDFELVAGGTPPAPSITGVFDDVAENVGNIMPGDSTNDTEPQVSGTAEPFSTVTLFANGVAVGSIVADALGNWSITPNPALLPGLNNLSATATNAAGNESAPTGDYPITVDVTPPAAADASQLEDNVGAITGPITSGDTTDDSTPTFSGTAEPNTTLIVFDNGVEIGRVPVDGAGNWSFTPAPPLANGPHSFSTFVVDAAGNRSPESAPIDFIVDTSAVAISIDQVTDDVGPNQGPLASGGVTDDTTPTLSGQATPNSTVNIYLDGVLLQAGVPVNALGQWEYTVNPALGEGNHAFSATVVTPGGGESAPTSDFNLEIDVTASAPPTIDAVTDDVGSIQGPVADGSTTDDTTPTLSGSGVSGDVMIIRNNGAEIGRVPVVDGSWSFTPNPPLNNGSTNVFDVIAEDPAGNRSQPSGSWTITIDTQGPGVPIITSVVDDFGADTGLINNGEATDDRTPTFNGTAEPGSTVSLFSGGTFLGSVVADETTGEWSITTPVLDLGVHNFTVSATDAAGNTSPEAGPYQIGIGSILVEGENFDALPPTVLPVGIPLTTPNGLILTAEIPTTPGSIPFAINLGSPTGGVASPVLFLGLNGAIKVDFPGEPTTISFETFGTPAPGNVARFFSEDGDPIGFITLQTTTNGAQVFTESFDAPPGVTIGYMRIETSAFDDAQGFFIDNFTWSGLSVPGAAGAGDTSGTEQSDVGTLVPGLEQDVIQEAASYGDDSENVFSVADVALFDSFKTVIHAGGGTDTLKLTGADQVLDLSAIAGKLESIEIIDLTGTGNNTLNLSLGDVLELGESSLFSTDETVQMLIKGNAGDVVNLDDLLADGTDPGDWAGQGTVTVEGIVYNVFQHSSLDAQLLVQDGVTTNLV